MREIELLQANQQWQEADSIVLAALWAPSTGTM